MKNPLYKRIPRMLWEEKGKYLVLFLLMALMIAECSGFLVGNESLISTYEDSFETYHIEDGHFSLKEKADESQLKSIGELDISLYELWYTDTALTNGSTLRIYAERTQVDLVCLMEGAMPAADGEIAIDRMYADNNGLSVGDTLSDDAHTWTITGLIAMSDYSTLFENNSDTMFDSILFGTAIVTQDAFGTFDESSLVWNYAWTWDEAPADESGEKDKADQLMKDINKIAPLESFVAQYENQAIMFTGDDFGGDKAMIQMLLYILIIILAFVFGITITGTIQSESGVIGTLLATGYTRRELLRHYLTLPAVTTLGAALIGNIAGYTVFKYLNVAAYYGSYSLPTYHTVWSSRAFWETTAVPMALMLAITYLILRRALGMPIMQFLRREGRKSRLRHALRLPHSLPFFTRFSLRVIWQNLGSYLTMLVGIFFANFLLLFGLCLAPLLHHYQNAIMDQAPAAYQYILNVPVSITAESNPLKQLAALIRFYGNVHTAQESAEPFSACYLKTVPEKDWKIDEVLIYGVAADSQYFDLDFDGESVYVSSSYAAKFGLTEGDTITLKEEYGDDTYTFTVAGVQEYDGALAIYMEQSQLNECFNLPDVYFAGYFSNEEITDIDESYIATVIDEEALTKVSRQLLVSMGSMMYILDVLSVLMYMILLYALTRIILEKNAQAISMSKILGYRSGEIGRLYLLPTTLVVLIVLIATLPLEGALLIKLFAVCLPIEMPGWIPLWLDKSCYWKIFVLGVVTYGVVAFLEYRKIRKIPMGEALKTIE